ncbi:TonB-dependent receptor [candidate division WOR-3 bacterium]|nr:TonB-dependent receptor [candidate division WOR-3 bacterium]
MTNVEFRMSNRRLVTVVALVLACAGAALAANTGTVTGRVTDRSTGEALVMANVQLIQDGVPTEYGAATDGNGRYQIINVAPGRYTVEASYMGYDPQAITNVLVIQDQNITVDLKLAETVIDLGIRKDIIGSKVKLVNPKTVTVERIITDEQFKRLPVTNLAELVGMQAGVSQSGGQTFLRGGRYDDVSYLVDGVAAQDAVYGTLWSSPRPTTDALQSVVVITGGFDAEYGEAMSGIIKAVTKEGSAKTTGRLRYTTDEVFPVPAYNYGYNRLSFSLGGPLPLVNRLRYFLSTEYYKTDDDRDCRYNTGRSPRGEYAVEGKLTYQFPKEFFLTREGLKLTLDAHHSNYQWRTYAHTYSFELEALYANRVRSYKGNLSLNHMLDPTTVYEAKFGWFNTSLMRAVRNFEAEADDTTGFWGFLRQYGAWDRYFFRGEDWVFNWEKYADYERSQGVPEKELVKNKREAVLALYRSYWLDRDNNRVYRHEGEKNFVTSYALIDYPYGVAGLFITEGDNRSWHYRATSNIIGKVDFTKTLNKVHEIKTGVNFTQYDISVYENSLPWDPNPFWDAFTYEPLVLAAYLQDKADFEDLVVRAGLRFDYLDSKAKVRAFPESLGARPEISDSLLPVEAKFRLSPRLGISYPITERVKFRFSYGHFFKNPSFNNLYTYADKSAAELRGRGNVIVGNADMSAEKTIAYELGFDAQLSDFFQFDLTAYYKDVFDLSGLRTVQALPQPYTMFYNVEYARIQGAEATMTKVLDDYWSARLGYTFQIAKGTASDAFAQYQRTEPYKIDYFLDQDQRHSVHGDLTFSFPSDFAFVLMRDFDVSGVANFGSGTPYTPTDTRGNPTGPENSARLPSTFSVDARVGKDIRLGGVGLALTCDITNVLNAEIITNVHTATGLPDYTGRRITQGEFSGGIAFGDFYYHPARDYDHDGYITQREAYTSYIIAYRDANDPPTYYGPPRKIRFGVSLSF